MPLWLWPDTLPGFKTRITANCPPVVSDNGSGDGCTVR